MMQSSLTVDGKAWLAGLARSVTVEHDYFPEVQGHIPDALEGTLYRNGPGRFDLGGVRKRHLLDGDGMIQAFDFQNGKVRYRNRFVRTEKYLAEQKAGKLLFPTWTTLAPGGMLRNMGNKIKSQAGVTVVVKNKRLYAFDEVGQPSTLDPSTLETVESHHLGALNAYPDYKAHTKTDAKTGAWLLLGVQNGPTMQLHLAEHASDGTLVRAQRIAAPRRSYFHDWFATERYVIVCLQPLQLSLPAFLSGAASFTDSLRWKPQKGNLLMVIDRSGVALPVVLPTSACFMWHVLNAYELGDSIVADFVGYDEPDHFLGKNAAFSAIMRGEQGVQNCAGKIRRYVVNPLQKQVVEDIINDGNHEFPMVADDVSLYRHRYGYFTTAANSTVFHNGLARLDMDSGKRDVFYMGADIHLGEPIVVRERGANDEQGWLLSVGLDGNTGTSFLGIFRSDRLADGPVAKVQLNDATPLSFHGWWR